MALIEGSIFLLSFLLDCIFVKSIIILFSLAILILQSICFV